MSEPLHVVAAAVVNTAGEVLIARRPEHVHQGGLWEFPGGKVVATETVLAALQREIDEELGIEVMQARPLIRIVHEYPEKTVLLDVWRVDAYTGQAYGKEGQVIRWTAISALRDYDFPAANEPVIMALGLPSEYLITPEPGNDVDVFLPELEQVLRRGIRLVQLRTKQLDRPAYISLADRVLDLCRSYGARLLLNSPPDLVEQIGADGLHMDSRQLMTVTERPLSRNFLLAASCHDQKELMHAQHLGADFAVLSPVLPTMSHPGVPGMGWEKFNSLTEMVSIPVYALGGMQIEDRHAAWRAGAQGIAAIRGLWL